MFNIESKYEDLQDSGHGSEATDELAGAIGSMTEMLSEMYFQLNDIEDAANNGYLGLEFPHVPGLGDLDEDAAEVVRELMTELTANLMTSIRDLTRFDRVDRR